MIRVLHLRCGEALYGAERVLLALAAATPAPYSPIIGAIGRASRPNLLALEANRHGLAALHFPTSARFDLRCARSVAAAARANGVALLHAHDSKSMVIAVCASALARVPLVATYHGDTSASLKLRGYEALGRALGNFTRGAVAVSQPLQGRLERCVVAAPVYHIPNALPETPALSADERLAARKKLQLKLDEPVICLVGRLSPEKGHRVLFEALRQMGQPPRTVIAGDGPLRESLQKKARGLPVEFVGYRSATRTIYAASDLAVIPSLMEGLPLVALEAMSLGVCVLSSSVGDLPSLLSAGAGYTVPRGDPVALAQAVRWLCASKMARQTATLRALERVRRYSVRAVADLYAGTVYARALRSAARTSAEDNQPA